MRFSKPVPVYPVHVRCTWFPLRNDRGAHSLSNREKARDAMKGIGYAVFQVFRDNATKWGWEIHRPEPACQMMNSRG